MFKLMVRVIILVMLLTSWVTHAGVYMQNNPDGTVTYSDRPTQNSVKVSIPAIINTAPAAKSNIAPVNKSIDGISNIPTNNNVASEALKQYTVFKITSPSDGDTLQNQANITIEVEIQPELMNDDKVQVVMDGKLTGYPIASKHLTVTEVSRGQHEIYVVIVNKDQTIVKKSNKITLYVHRASSNFNPA